MSAVSQSHHWLLCLHISTGRSVTNVASVGEVVVCSTHPNIRRYHGGEKGVKIPYMESPPPPTNIGNSTNNAVISTPISPSLLTPPPRQSGLIDRSIVCVRMIASPPTGCNENFEEDEGVESKIGHDGASEMKNYAPPPSSISFLKNQGDGVDEGTRQSCC